MTLGKPKTVITVAPRYNEDLVTVKYVETNPAITNPAKTNPAITKSPLYNNELILTVPTHNLPRCNEHFVLSLAVSKNDMMIQMVDKPNTTPIDQDPAITNIFSVP